LEGNAIFEEKIPEVGVPGLRVRHHGGDVVAEDKRFVEFPVKKEKELVLGVLAGDAPQVFIRELPDTLQSVFQQQACVDGNFHVGELFFS
jgi:hypothetical protein